MTYIATRDRAALRCRDWGEGRPVVLLHGWPLDSDMWEYQSLFLASNGLRVVAYDRRGFGRSSQPWTGYDYDTMTDDLHTVLERLNLQDVTLVGFSMGGGEVARYMTRHGGARVSRVVLVSAVTPFLLRTEDNPDGIARDVFDRMIGELRQDRPHFLAKFSRNFFGAGRRSNGVSQEIHQWTLAMGLRGSPKATQDCVRAFSETDFRDDLRHIRVPTLIIHGDGDTTVPLELSGRLAVRQIKSAELKVYRGAPHGLFFTEKDRLNHDLLEFIPH